MNMQGHITASAVRFIKLGEKGEWERDCIEGPSPCIRIGFRSGQHQQCLAGDWDAVAKYWSTAGGKTKGKATEFTNQVKTFYTADEETLWITFYNRKLWWCFASKEVEERAEDQTRIRRTIGPWSCSDIHGKELSVDSLSGSLTKVQGFRGTICAVEEKDYLLRRINGELPTEVVRAVACLRDLEGAVQRLITRLHWKDFELLCDLIFTQAGWQRLGTLGKTEKTVDMELLSPVSGRRAWVQVKSSADVSTFLEYTARFKEMAGYDEMYFVVHTPTSELASHQPSSGVVILTANRLASLAVSSGLTNWLIRKTS